MQRTEHKCFSIVKGRTVSLARMGLETGDGPHGSQLHMQRQKVVEDVDHMGTSVRTQYIMLRIHCEKQ